MNTPETDWLDQQLTEQRLGVLDAIVCEVLQDLSTEEAAAAARNYRSLRRQGKTVRKTIDCLIATFCLNGGHTLLHCDSDFNPFEEHLGLQVIHPPSAA